MSLKDFNEVKSLVLQQEQSFIEVAKIHNAVNFKAECQFALQALQNNDYLLEVAQKNPISLKNSIINVAAIGISLNPALKQASLVPRKGKVCLDIQYVGLCKLGTDTRSIYWVQAELVRKNDKFNFNGVGEKVTHVFDPFCKDRGEIIGAYATAKTSGNDYLTTVMSINEIYDIRDRTEAWKAYMDKKIQTCPWYSDPGEMIKKTVVKRASKMWPQTDQTERLSRAIGVVDEHEGIDFKNEIIPASAEDIQKISTLLNEIDNGEKRLLVHLRVKFKKEFENININNNL